MKCGIARIEVEIWFIDRQTKKSNLPFLWNFDYSSHYFACLTSKYFFAFITFGDGFFQFEDNKLSLKQAPDHYYENTIFQLGQHPFNCSFIVIRKSENDMVTVNSFSVKHLMGAPVIWVFTNSK